MKKTNKTNMPEPLSLAEQEKVKKAFQIFQQTMISYVAEASGLAEQNSMDPGLIFQDAAKSVLTATKRFLGMSIGGGHLAKYEDLKINQDYTILVTVYPHKDKVPMKIMVHLTEPRR